MKLSVYQKRQEMLRDFGYVDEDALKIYAERRSAWKRGQLPKNDSMYDPEEQKRVLERMKKNGCRKCEQRRQEKWIESLTEGKI